MKTLPFGKTSQGEAAELYVLSNANGMTVSISNYGASIVSICVPSASGKLVDVVLGYDSAAGYEADANWFGALVGRNANRIAGAQFEIAGETVQLAATEGPNSLHSQPDRWMHRMWTLVREENVRSTAADRVTLELHSEDGDQGFPAALDMTVTYTLTSDDKLEIAYSGQPDGPTLINLTNHSYFNLNGHDSGSTLGHTLSVNADYYTPFDDTNIPTGVIASVAGTPFDLREPITLKECFARGIDGLDNNYVLRTQGAFRPAGRLVGDVTGIVLDVLTDTCGLQIYTAGGLQPCAGKDGAQYQPGDAVCLESQFHPDAIHHPDWPQPVFNADNPYRSRTTFAFSNQA